MESFDKLLEELNLNNASVTRISPTGAEKLGTWINAISPLLLIVGVIGFYINSKRPDSDCPASWELSRFQFIFWAATWRVCRVRGMDRRVHCRASIGHRRNFYSARDDGGRVAGRGNDVYRVDHGDG